MAAARWKKRSLKHLLGFSVILPGASGVARLASLSTAEHLGLVQAFSHLTAGIDVLIVDTAAGIADSVRQFCQAAQQVLVVLRDEPASLTDAYALIKLLHRTMVCAGSGYWPTCRLRRVQARGCSASSSA